MVCGSASAPSNKEKKPQRGEGKRERMRENESKRSRLGHGTFMVPVKQGKKSFFSFSAVRPQWGSAGRHGRTEETHSAPDTQKAAVMAAVPQAISSGDNPRR